MLKPINGEIAEMLHQSIKAGISFLDAVYGREWVTRINLDALELESSCDCILGQLEGSFFYAYEKLDLDVSQVSAYGLYIGFVEAIQDWDEVTRLYKQLTQCWRDSIASLIIERKDENDAYDDFMMGVSASCYEN